MKNRIRVLHVCDQLAMGGIERMIVNITKYLPRERVKSYVCMTHNVGPLAPALDADVPYVCLDKTAKVDLAAAFRLIRHVRDNAIDIVHVHGGSILFVALASCLGPFPKIIWHDHWGALYSQERPVLIFGAAVRRVHTIISVNDGLKEWAIKRLLFSPEQVTYLPNFTLKPELSATPPALPGTAGKRIVCVANLRPEKDHKNLLEAMKIVVKEVPDAHLIMVGEVHQPAIADYIQREISAAPLKNHATFLGTRLDVPDILHACDVGVLSSKSEGLPVILLEFGMAGKAGLAAVATDIGQCREVMPDERYGILVPTMNAPALAKAIVELLTSPQRRKDLGRAFHQRILDVYSPEAVIGRITALYDKVLSDS